MHSNSSVAEALLSIERNDQTSNGAVNGALKRLEDVDIPSLSLSLQGVASFRSVDKFLIGVYACL
jgi:hypothetical protein